MDRILTFTFDVFGEKYDIKAQNLILAKLTLVKILEENSSIKTEGVSFSYFEDYNYIVEIYLKNSETLFNLFDSSSVDLNQTLVSLISKYDFLIKDYSTTSAINSLHRHLNKEDKSYDVTIHDLLTHPIYDIYRAKNMGESRIIQLIKVLSLVMPFKELVVNN